MPLTRDRKTPFRPGLAYNFPVAASTLIYQGSLVGINAAGDLVPASASNVLRIVGTSKEHIDNSAGIAGALRCEVDPTTARWDNSTSTDAITIANALGRPVYAVDDDQVALTDNGGLRPVAGICVDVDADGVWVKSTPEAVASSAVASGRNVPMYIDTNVSATGFVARYVHSGPPMRIRAIRSVISAALATGNMTITAAIDGVAVTGGVVTVTQAGSAAGDVDLAEPTAANTISEGQVLSLTVGGTNTGAGHTDVTVELAA